MCSVFGADIMYHKIRMVSYIRRYQHELDKVQNVVDGGKSTKQALFDGIVEQMEDGLQHGYGYTLTYVRDKLNISAVDC